MQAQTHIVYLVLLTYFTVGYSLTLPAMATMRCALAKSYGKAAEVVSMGSLPRPVLLKGNNTMLVRVKACSLSPSDYRMMSGDTQLVKKPKAGFPYIPGGDVAGEVVEIDPMAKDPKFKAGDSVMATWDMFGEGGMAEYHIVDMAYAVPLPVGVTMVEGAALANSASHSMLVHDAAKVKVGDRVLVLGGSGGVGTVLVQLLKHSGAYVVATSTAEGVVKGCGADEVVNYKEKNVWETYADKPFDTVIDCAVGQEAWRAARRSSALKNGGHFFAVVLNDWQIDVTKWWQFFPMMLPPMGRNMWTSITGLFGGKRYHMFLGGATAPTMEKVSGLVSDKTIKVVVDGASPHPFTEAGVRAAMTLHEDRRGKGKIVVKIAD